MEPSTSSSTVFLSLREVCRRLFSFRLLYGIVPGMSSLEIAPLTPSPNNTHCRQELESRVDLRPTRRSKSFKGRKTSRPPHTFAVSDRVLVAKVAVFSTNKWPAFTLK